MTSSKKIQPNIVILLQACYRHAQPALRAFVGVHSSFGREARHARTRITNSHHSRTARPRRRRRKLLSECWKRRKLLKMVRSELLRTDEADIEPPPIPTRRQNTSSDEIDVPFNSLPPTRERFDAESTPHTTDVNIEGNFSDVKTNERIIHVVPTTVSKMAKWDGKDDPSPASNKKNEKVAEEKVAETTMLPKKDTVEESKSSSKKKWANTFSLKKALVASTKKGDRRDNKKGASSSKKGKDVWEKKVKLVNGFKEYGSIVGSIHQLTLYTFHDLLQPTGAASDETRSPASQKFINAVSAASKKSSSNSSCNVLVLGNMHGALCKGAKLEEALEATHVGCGLAAGEVIRQAVLYLPGADFVVAGGDPLSYPTPRDRLRDGEWMVKAGDDILVHAAVNAAKWAATAALRNKTLKRGAKKDAMHQKRGLQILDFDGKGFSVVGAESCNVEEINRLGSGMLKTYPLTDCSVIEHMVALQGAWLDVRFRAFHEHQKYEDDAKQLPIKLKRLRNTAVCQVGYTLLKSPVEAIKLMDVCRLAGRFHAKAQAGDKFWVETVEPEGWCATTAGAPQPSTQQFGPRDFVDFLSNFLPEEEE